MGWKEKMQDDIERKKARAYFRSHNSEILQGKDIPLLLLLGVVAGLIVTIIFEFIMNNVGFYLEIAYLIIGYVVADTVCRKSGIHSKQTAAVAAVATVLAFVCAAVFFAFLYHGDFSTFFSVLFESPFAILMKIISIVVAYWVALQ